MAAFETLMKTVRGIAIPRQPVKSKTAALSGSSLEKERRRRMMAATKESLPRNLKLFARIALNRSQSSSFKSFGVSAALDFARTSSSISSKNFMFPI